MPLSIFAMVLSTSFFIAGIRKIIGHWLEFKSQATKIILFRDDRANSTLFELWPDFVFEALDWATVIFEVSFIFFFPLSKKFRLCLVAAILFHWSVAIIQGIYFLHLPFTYVAFFVAYRARVKILENLVLVKYLLLSLAGLGVVHIIYFVAIRNNIFSNGILYWSSINTNYLVSILFATFLLMGIRRQITKKVISLEQ
ncbi:MAG: hypothetical protein JXQ87_14755 [Bacteroidia bacterium]